MEIEALLGGRSRCAVLEGLAEAKTPVTAYQIAMSKGLDPAATYRCLTEFSKFGIVESEIKGRNQTFYRLSKGAGKAAAEYLRSLKQKTSESIDLDRWISPEMQAGRMAKIVKINPGRLGASQFGKAAERKGAKELLSKRVPGELSAIIRSAQIAFNELFKQKDGVFILRT